MTRFYFLIASVIFFLATIGLMASGMQAGNFDRIGVAILVMMPLFLACVVFYMYFSGGAGQQKIANYFRDVASQWNAGFFDEFPGSLAATYHDLSFVKQGRSVKATSVIRKGIPDGQCHIFIRDTGVEDGRSIRSIVAVVNRVSTGQKIKIAPRPTSPSAYLAAFIQGFENLLSGNSSKKEPRLSGTPERETLWADRLAGIYSIEGDADLSEQLMMFLVQHPNLEIESTDKHLYVSRGGGFWALRSKQATEQFLGELLEDITTLAKLLRA